MDIRGKTEQRCAAVVQVLQQSDGPMSYDDIRLSTGGKRRSDGTVKGGISYDILLYVVSALVEVGLVTKTRIETRKPGNPRVQFTWTGKVNLARALGVRSARAA